MNARLNAVLQLLGVFWAAREARERRMLLLAASVILAAAGYLLLIAPALSGREKLRATLPPLREQVAQLQTLSSIAMNLAAVTDTPPAAMTKETLTRTLVAHNLKVQSLSVTAETAQVTLVGASFAQTLRWLDELQKSSRVNVSAAKITALAQPDQVDASFTLQQTGTP
jgi:general secretion pathway protein M